MAQTDIVMLIVVPPTFTWLISQIVNVLCIDGTGVEQSLIHIPSGP